MIDRSQSPECENGMRIAVALADRDNPAQIANDGRETKIVRGVFGEPEEEGDQCLTPKK